MTHLMNSVRPIPLYKLFLAYEYPWWNSVAAAPTRPLQGRSLADTPVRQLDYWPVDPAAATPATTGPALLMAYNDATNVDFWEGLSGEAPGHAGSSRSSATTTTSGRSRPAVRMFQSLTRHRPPKAGRRAAARYHHNWVDHRAPHEMVMEMHRQIARMHDVSGAPAPIDAAYMDWSTDPYGGGVHFWNRGYKSWEVLQQMTQPVDDFPCYSAAKRTQPIRHGSKALCRPRRSCYRITSVWRSPHGSRQPKPPKAAQRKQNARSSSRLK